MRWTWVPAAALLVAACGGEAREQPGAAVREEPGEAVPEGPGEAVLASRATEGEAVLRQAFVLQETYRAERGRFARTFAELEEVGWTSPEGMLRIYQPPRIVRARADELCMVIEPKDTDSWPQHVDQSGQVRRGPCP